MSKDCQRASGVYVAKLSYVGVVRFGADAYINIGVRSYEIVCSSCRVFVPNVCLLADVCVIHRPVSCTSSGRNVLASQRVRYVVVHNLGWFDVW